MKNSWYALVALDTSSNNEREEKKKGRPHNSFGVYSLSLLLSVIMFFREQERDPHTKGRTESLKDIRRYVDDHHLLQMGKKSDITTRLHIVPNFGFAGWLGWLPTGVGSLIFFPLHYQIQIRPMMAICGSLHSFAALTCFSANTGYCVGGVRIITLHFVCRVGGVWQPQKVPSRQSLCNTKE